ncbi:MAG: hypothetical protein IPM70_12005 [Proteobacteria bacterium]|nr:hypothetical protein [Pseudomonadota bacterium]
MATSGTSFLENPAPGVAVQNMYLQTDLGALIKAKESVGRQKDLLAAMELRAIASRER